MKTTVYHWEPVSDTQLRQSVSKWVGGDIEAMSQLLIPHNQQHLRLILVQNLRLFQQNPLPNTRMLLIQQGTHTPKHPYRLICRSTPPPLKVNPTLMREYAHSNKHPDDRVQSFQRMFHNNHAKTITENNIQIGVRPKIETNDLACVGYLEEINKLVLLKDRTLEVIGEAPDNPDNTSVSGWISSMKAEERMQLMSILSCHSLLGYKSEESVLFYSLIDEDGESSTLDAIKNTFDYFRVPFNKECFEVHMCEEYQDIEAKIESYVLMAENSFDLEHKLIRVFNKGILVIEFVAENRELLCYERMESAIESKEVFVPERGLFPPVYYHKVYSIFNQFQGDLRGLALKDKIKVIAYSQELNIPVRSILQSAFVRDITRIHYNQFENSGINTFMVYLVMGPEGMKGSLFDTLKTKVEDMGSTAIILKSNDQEVMELEEGELRNFVNQKGAFDKSKYSFILVDYPFHCDMPCVLEQTVRKVCPPKCHYNIFHILPRCETPFSFYNEILDKDIFFPFNLSLMLYCLKNSQDRALGVNKRLTPLENLSKSIHHLCFNFRSFKADLYKGSRLRLIEVEYHVRFKEVLEGVILSLEDLLEMSYKKEYSENQNVLHYFLEEVESLEVEEEPDLDQVSEEILLASFKKVPFYHIL